MSTVANQKWWMLGAAAALIACGSAAEATDGLAAPGDDSGATNGGDGGAETNSPTTGAGAVANDPSVSGIIVVHASRNLPAFRLCFPSEATLLPLPTDTLMPNSNVVGVDVGAAVHIGSLGNDSNTGSPITPTYDAGTTTSNDAGIEEGGTEAGAQDAGQPAVDAGPPPPDPIYVIDEKVARQFYQSGTDPSTWPSCGVLVDVLKANNLEGQGLYTVNGAAGTPGTSVLATSAGVNLLIFEGCLPDPTLDVAACGTGFTKTAGNLTYRIVTGLDVPRTAEDGGSGEFLFQAMQLSPRIDSDLQNSETVSLTFGPLASIASGVAIPDTLTLDTLVPSSAPLAVSFTPASLDDYDSYGFALQAGATDGISQSLATIQAQSSPTDLPQSFYLLPSNFVVLIVGDPQATPGANGPGASLHLLAVPVRDPATLEDAGAPITTTDGG